MPQVSKADMKLSFAQNNGGWRMAKGMGTAQGPGNYPKLEVDYDHQGEFIFKILNPRETKFAMTDAFVPKASKNNPADFGNQFTVTGQGTDTLTVTVANADVSKPGQPYNGGDYHYELRFTDKPALDPIITNGGCCQTQTNYMVYYALGAVAFLVLFILVIRPMLARRSTRPTPASTEDRDLS